MSITIGTPKYLLIYLSIYSLRRSKLYIGFLIDAVMHEIYQGVQSRNILRPYSCA